jgi:hypothetical protein
MWLDLTQQHAHLTTEAKMYNVRLVAHLQSIAREIEMVFFKNRLMLSN